MTDTTVLQTSEAIARRVAELGRQITSDFRGTEQLTLVGALAGCFIFMADLAREIALPVRCEFMQLE